jgi:hypothetical protein
MYPIQPILATGFQTTHLELLVYPGYLLDSSTDQIPWARYLLLYRYDLTGSSEYRLQNRRNYKSRQFPPENSFFKAILQNDGCRY